MIIGWLVAAALAQSDASSGYACDLASFDAAQNQRRSSIISEMSEMMIKFDGFSRRRIAILDRLDEIGRMGPAKRALKSTFNPDYDANVLKGRNESLQVQIDGLNERFQFSKRQLDFLKLDREAFFSKCPEVRR